MSKRSRKNNQSQFKELLSIIIPVHGRFDLLEQCLSALPEAAGDITYKVILIDNSSPKEEADPFYAKLPNAFAVIRNKTNVGFPKACNQGARKSLSPLLFFLNSDVILKPGAISNMVKVLDDPNVGIVGAKLIFPHGTQSGPEGKVQHVGLATDIRGDWIHLFIGWNPDNAKVRRVRDVLAVTGAALMTRRSIYSQVGGFDEVYGMGTYEDVEYCMKVRLTGKNIIVEQSAVGEHWTNATARQYGIGFPLQQNKSIFMSRWMNKYPWSSWLHL